MRLTDEEIDDLYSECRCDVRVMPELGRLSRRFARAVETITAERCAALCDERVAPAYDRWRRNGRHYDDGQCDMAQELGDAIRALPDKESGNAPHD